AGEGLVRPGQHAVLGPAVEPRIAPPVVECVAVQVEPIEDRALVLEPPQPLFHRAHAAAPTMQTVETAPGPPSVCASPRRAPSPCRSPGRPSTWSPISAIILTPVAPTGWPHDCRPPERLTGMSPPNAVAPLSSRAPPSPRPQRPRSSVLTSSVTVKQSWH